MGSRFQVVEQGPPIEVFLLNKLFTDDTFQNKVNLGVGAYRDENGKPWVLPVVRKMELKMAQDGNLLHEYLPVLATGMRLMNIGLPQECLHQFVVSCLHPTTSYKLRPSRRPTLPNVLQVN